MAEPLAGMHLNKRQVMREAAPRRDMLPDSPWDTWLRKATRNDHPSAD